MEDKGEVNTNLSLLLFKLNHENFVVSHEAFQRKFFNQQLELEEIREMQYMPIDFFN